MRIVQGTFETVLLDRTFENIVLTHVLEHLDDPVGVLSRVNREWLSEAGRLFVVSRTPMRRRGRLRFGWD